MPVSINGSGSITGVSSLTQLTKLGVTGILTATDFSGPSGGAADFPNGLTATTASFSGNLSVGGVLTYDDVTNIDSVGIITARAGIHVTGGSVGISTNSITANTNADDLQIGSRTDGIERGITIASSLAGSLRFADDGNDTAGWMYYSHSDNSLRLGANGSEKLRIDSAGSVIIGDSDTDNANVIANDLVVGNTSQRSGITIVSGSGDDGNIFFSDGTGSAALKGQIVYNHTSDRFSFYTAAAERLRIGNAGNVGIKNAVAATIDAVNNAGTLVVGDGSSAEGITIYTSDSTSGELAFADGTSGSATQRGRIIYAHGDNSMRISTNGSEALRITSTGLVGIGTDNPGTKLDVRGGNWSNGDIVVGQSGNAGRVKFRRGVDGSDSAFIGFAAADNNSRLSIGVDSGDGTIAFQTNSAERLRITSTGLVGIGTDNPGEPLHVFVGNGGNGEPIALFEHDHGSGGDASIRIEGGASGNPDEVYLELCDKDDSSNSWTMGMNDDKTRLRFEYGAKGANNGKQLLTLDQSGAARFNGASGVLRDPTIDNTSYVGLTLWPSGTGGSSNYSDKHNISFTQEDGNWVDGHSSSTNTSWGMNFNYTSNGTTMQTRSGIHYDIRGGERLKIWSSYGDISFKVDSGSSGNETWTTCDKEVMRLSHDGHVLRPTMAAACCTTTGATTLSTFNTSYQTIAVNVEGYDNANNFNTSNYRFTAPETGFYQVGCNVQLEGASGPSGNKWMYFYPLVNGSDPATSTGNNHADFDPTVTHYYNWTYTTLLKLSQNDYVEWKYRGNLSSVTLKGGVESTYYFYQVG